jgi:hypothetical protein
MTGEIPDYVNPDGTKAILGDVVYYRDGKHHFGIEVKLGIVRLTKKEFNEWIVGGDKPRWPNLYIGIAADGICLAPWETFREAYFKSVRLRKLGWSAVEIKGGYGPMVSVSSLSKHLPTTCHFPWSNDVDNSLSLEEQFTLSLATEIVALKRHTAMPIN